MCGKILKRVITACLLLGLSFCYCLQVSADGGTMNQAEPRQTITMSTSQWNLLKTEFNGLKNDLAMERQKLTMLKLDSSEQVQQLEVTDTARRNAAIINECEDINDRSTARIERIESIIRRVEEQNKEVGTQTSSHT